jgi:hypothetical protein
LQGPQQASQVINEVGLLQSPKYFFSLMLSLKHTQAEEQTTELVEPINATVVVNTQRIQTHCSQQKNISHPHKIFWGENAYR